jgi:hypothetical protein
MLIRHANRRSRRRRRKEEEEGGRRKEEGERRRGEGKDIRKLDEQMVGSGGAAVGSDADASEE